MAQAGNDADDLAVSLTWAGEAAVVADPAAAPAPPPGARQEPRPAPYDQGPRDRRSAPAAAPAEADPQPRPASRPPQPATPPDQRPAPHATARPAGPRSEVPWASPLPRRTWPVEEPQSNETLLNILEHLSTLSRLITGTSRASSAELEALGSRVDKAVADLDALQLRVLRSLAGFDTLRLRVQKQLADRPPLTDEDVARIADAVTDRLLDHVRVQTEGGDSTSAPEAGGTPA
jgi:hypothetical protein